MSRSIPSWLTGRLCGAARPSSTPTVGLGALRQASHPSRRFGMNGASFVSPLIPDAPKIKYSIQTDTSSWPSDAQLRISRAANEPNRYLRSYRYPHIICRLSRQFYSSSSKPRDTKFLPTKEKAKSDPKPEQARTDGEPQNGAAGAEPSNAESHAESLAASVSKYLHLPKMPHRPTKEELLAAANGFWERLRVRFKWMSIRSMRPWNADEWGAFVSWVLFGHILWVLVGTTTFFSLLILSINTVFAQGKLPRPFLSQLDAC